MNRFTSDIMPQVPGCPKALIKKEVLRSAIQFCMDSHIWQIDAQKEVLPGDDEITLSTVTGSEVTACQISINGSGVNEYTRNGAIITLNTAVTANTSFNTTSFLKPTRAAADLPDLLYNDWFEAIESGAIANLMLMPGKKWTSPQLGKVNYQKYMHGLGEAKIKAMRPNDQSRLMIKQRPFV